MKLFMLPLVFITFATLGLENAKAQSYSYLQQAKTPVAAYCEENRFENYINLASAMRDYVTPLDYARLYIPLKKKAATAKITMKNFGPLSARTHASVLDIVKFVEAHDGEFSALWEVEAYFTIAQDLMDMTQVLARDLQ